MSLPKALQIDLDGCYALIGDRSPYDADLCGLDEVNEAVHMVAGWARADGYGIVLASGRGFKVTHRYATEQWLFWNGIHYDQLSMRSPGDGRPDVEVKEELYRREIEPYWDVDLVLEDKRDLVDLWRGLGLASFQVADWPPAKMGQSTT